MRLNIDFDSDVESDQKLWMDVNDSAISRGFNSAEDFVKSMLQEASSKKVSNHHKQVEKDIGDALWALYQTKDLLDVIAARLTKLVETE